MDLMLPAAAHRNVALGTDGLAGPDRFVKADRYRLKQVLLNLVSNAVKFNIEGGRATVALSTPAPGKVRLSVTDTGPGLRSGRFRADLHAVRPAGRRPAGHRGHRARADAGQGPRHQDGRHYRRRIDARAAAARSGSSWTRPARQRRPAAVAAATSDSRPPNRAMVLQIEDNVSNTDLIEHVLASVPESR